MNNLYFKITGGPIKETYESHLRKHKEVTEQIQAFSKELGAKEACFSAYGIRSFLFDTKPKGWKKHPKIAGYIPGAKMVELQDRMRSLVPPTQSGFLKEISGKEAGCVLIGSTMYNAAAAYQVIDESVAVLTLNQKPKGDSGNDWGDWWIPETTEHCTPLKNSEYWALIEQKKEAESVPA